MIKPPEESSTQAEQNDTTVDAVESMPNPMFRPAPDSGSGSSAFVPLES